MSAKAPVCHIPPAATTVPQPSVRNLPAIPVAQPTIASLMASVNAMRETIYIITGQQTIYGQNAKSKDAKGQWTEDRRVTEKVKVYNPDDNTQYIEVERINQLDMINKDTKQKWTWKR